PRASQQAGSNKSTCSPRTTARDTTVGLLRCADAHTRRCIRSATCCRNRKDGADNQLPPIAATALPSLPSNNSGLRSLVPPEMTNGTASSPAASLICHTASSSRPFSNWPARGPTPPMPEPTSTATADQLWTAFAQGLILVRCCSLL